MSVTVPALFSNDMSWHYIQNSVAGATAIFLLGAVFCDFLHQKLQSPPSPGTNTIYHPLFYHQKQCRTTTATFKVCPPFRSTWLNTFQISSKSRFYLVIRAHARNRRQRCLLLREWVCPSFHLDAPKEETNSLAPIFPPSPKKKGQKEVVIQHYN